MLWLESAPGAIEHWFPAISDRNHVAVSVPGPILERAVRGRPPWPTGHSALRSATAAIDAALAAAEQSISINFDRAILAGCGAAGALALAIAFTRPGVPAQAAAIDPVPLPLIPLLREIHRLKGQVDDCDVADDVPAHQPVARRLVHWLHRAIGCSRCQGPGLEISVDLV